ncbi:MAG TPA: 4-hydroxyphenylpyruvate dioxygenase [Nostocaceae cyanobacterium]|nr:4-hydroxyphenylpyruvate dioxygenase [Nostocaceae cyanobacterium]
MLDFWVMLQIDHVHFYVENAQRWRDWFVDCLGFEVMTGGVFPWLSADEKFLHTRTEIVKSGGICFLISSPLLSSSPVAEFLRQHPPGVADLAFAVADVEGLTARARKNGVRILQAVGAVGGRKCSQIAAWGGLSHTLIEGGMVTQGLSVVNERIFTDIDHIVLNVPVGDLNRAVGWYKDIFDFQPQQKFNIQSDRSSLSSQVLVSANGQVQLPINEPASHNSQIQEFLDVNRGAGIQHIALKTAHLVQAISCLRAAGLSFLSTPPNYYSFLQQRPGLPLSVEELKAIAQQQILVDWQDDAPCGALLLQIFTQPIFGIPTFFFEFIERRAQAVGFGEGNFRALFAAIEREQIKRGISRQEAGGRRQGEEAGEQGAF